MRVLVVADGRRGVGLGHVTRCSAISTALLARGVGVRCIALGAASRPHSSLRWEATADESALAPDAPPGLLLCDGYELDAGALQARTGARRLAVMHDIGEPPATADLVVSTDPSLVGRTPGIIGGPALTPLGPAYWGLPEPPPPRREIARVLVTMGGGDPGGHAVPIAAAVRRAVGDRVEVVLVRGPQADFTAPEGVVLLDRPASMLEALRSADLAVTACGSSLLEALAVGTPAIGVPVADNQRPKAGEIAARGATELIEPSDRAAIGAALARLGGDPDVRGARARAGRGLVDGHGALRIAFRLAELLGG